jgi:AraC family transcriptional regulator
MPLSKTQPKAFEQIRKFTGQIEPEQLKYVDSFPGENVAMFMPVAGPCMLAISPFHTHPTSMFVVNFSDTTSIVLQNGKYRAQPNTVSYLPANIPHHEVNETGIPRYVAIMVDPLFLQEQAEAYLQHNLNLDQWKVFPASEELVSVIKRFISESKSYKAGSERLLEALSVELVHIMLRSMIGLKLSSCTHVSRIEINRCIEYMRQNLSEKLSLESLACFSGMSVSHFTRVFRQETGLSPIDYLIEMRLDVACRLLLSGNIPLKQIALDCGFSSQAHFSASFQKKYKMAPSEYLHSPLLK